MEPLELYGWVAAAAAAPLQITLAVAVLTLLHAARGRWRTVDLFLVAVLSQQLLAALLALGFSLLRLMRPDASPACAAFAWAWTAVRTLQASTVASMAADRVLTAQWPYKYRYSVRRNQIRYHIGVLATVAVLVGTAALFSAGGTAGDEEADTEHSTCSFLPYHINTKFAVFLMSLHVLLALVAGGSMLTVQILLCLRPRLRHAHSDLNPLNHTTSDTSTSSGSGGAAPRYGALSANNTLAASGIATLPHPVNRRRRRAVRRLSDFRWPTVALTTTLCHLVNHLPYLALLVLGTFLPELLPAWPMEALAVWLSVAEGILLAPLLLCVDSTLRQAVRSTVSRRRDDQHPDGGHPFRAKEGLGLGAAAEAKFPITNGSLFSLQDGTSLHAVRSRSLKMGVGTLGSGDTPNKPRFLPTLFDPVRMSSGGDTRSEPLYSDPIQRTASLDSIIKCLPPGDEPIYATLSTGRTSPDRCNSATTIANDDFEFRGSKRFCGGARRSEDAGLALQPTHTDTAHDHMSIRSTASGVTIRVEAPAPPPRPSLQRMRRTDNSGAAGGSGGNSAASLKRKMALSMNDLDAVGAAGPALVNDQRRAGSVPSCRMSCYGVPCRSDSDLAANCTRPQPTLRHGLEPSIQRVRASPRGTAQRVMRYKKSSPRRRWRDQTPARAAAHRQGHSLMALNEIRAERGPARGDIVSVEALNQAMALTPYSYLDNGEVYRHHSRSVPDFQKVFISGFL